MEEYENLAPNDSDVGWFVDFFPHIKIKYTSKEEFYAIPRVQDALFYELLVVSESRPSTSKWSTSPMLKTLRFSYLLGLSGWKSKFIGLLFGGTLGLPHYNEEAVIEYRKKVASLHDITRPMMAEQRGKCKICGDYHSVLQIDFHDDVPVRLICEKCQNLIKETKALFCK